MAKITSFSSQLAIKEAQGFPLEVKPDAFSVLFCPGSRVVIRGPLELNTSA